MRARRYKIPQPLRDGAGLRVTVKASPPPGATADMALLVSQYLPRSIADFVVVSATGALSQNVSVVVAPPTGRYYVAVYAAVASNTTITASHVNPVTAPPVVVSFWRMLLNWLAHNSTGRVVGLTLAVLVGLICCCCVCMNCRDSAQARRAAMVAAKARSGAARAAAKAGGGEAYAESAAIAPRPLLMMPVITTASLPGPPMLAAPTAAASMADRVREVRAQQFAAMQMMAGRVPPRR